MAVDCEMLMMGDPCGAGTLARGFRCSAKFPLHAGAPFLRRSLHTWGARKRIEKLRYLLVTPGLVSRDVDGSLRRLGIAQREKFPGLSTRRKPRSVGHSPWAATRPSVLLFALLSFLFLPAPLLFFLALNFLYFAWVRWFLVPHFGRNTPL